MRTFLIFVLSIIPCLANATEMRPMQTVVTWNNECLPKADPNAPEALVAIGVAAVAILGPKVIAASIDAAATALKNAGKDKEVAKVSFSKDTLLYALSNGGDLIIPPDRQCVQIYWGKLDNNLKETNDFVLKFVARVDPVKGATGFFRLTPVKFDIGEFAANSLISHNTRNYTISLTLAVPGADKPFASTTFVFNDVTTKGLASDTPDLQLNQSDVLAFPPTTDSAKKAQIARTAEIAPYVIAADIRNQTTEAAKTPKFLQQPTIYDDDEGIPNKIDAYCKVQTKFNDKVPVQFALNDDLCAYRVTVAKRTVSKAINEYGRTGKTLAWAESVCTIARSEKASADAAAVIDAAKQSKDGAKPKVASGNEKTVEQKDCPFPDLTDAASKTHFGAMTTKVTITEVRPGSKFAGELGNILGAAKDDLAKEISNRVIPSLRDAAEAADSASDRNIRRGILIADLKVKTANDLLAEVLADTDRKESDVTSARAAVLLAQISANDAYRLAGQTPPYPQAD